MFPTEKQLSIEPSIRKALGRYLLKKYYWNSNKLREIIEVFGECKYKVIHEAGSCDFIVVVAHNKRKIRFTCRDIENVLKDKKIEIQNAKDHDIHNAVAGICDLELE